MLIDFELCIQIGEKSKKRGTARFLSLALSICTNNDLHEFKQRDDFESLLFITLYWLNHRVGEFISFILSFSFDSFEKGKSETKLILFLKNPNEKILAWEEYEKVSTMLKEKSFSECLKFIQSRRKLCKETLSNDTITLLKSWKDQLFVGYPTTKYETAQDLERISALEGDKEVN